VTLVSKKLHGRLRRHHAPCAKITAYTLAVALSATKTLRARAERSPKTLAKNSAAIIWTA
jgi:hypothetical protein